MSGQTTSARAVARRRAREVSARRKAEAEAREERICGLLARYFESADHAARYEARAAAAVGELLHIAGTVTDVAGLCGISVSAVRNLAAIAALDEQDEPAGGAEHSADGVRKPGPRRKYAGDRGDRADADDGQAGVLAGTS